MSEHRHPIERNEHQPWLVSRTGIVTVGALAIIAFLIYRGHTAHLLGLLPYALLLACPLMHIFMHHGHGGHTHRHDQHSHQNNASYRGDSEPGEKP